MLNRFEVCVFFFFFDSSFRSQNNRVLALSQIQGDIPSVPVHFVCSRGTIKSLTNTQVLRSPIIRKLICICSIGTHRKLIFY